MQPNDTDGHGIKRLQNAIFITFIRFVFFDIKRHGAKVKLLSSNMGTTNLKLEILG